MKKIMSATIVAAAAISGFIGYSKATTSSISALALANVEALTDVQEINGKWCTVDEIPCASSASEVRVDCSYTNCTTCESEAGKAASENGTCTSVRILDI